jgi:hypothetical protein
MYEQVRAYKESATDQVKSRTLPVEEFIRRFLQHGPSTFPAPTVRPSLRNAPRNRAR